MTTLSEIDQEKNFIKAGILENEWWRDRGLPVVSNRLETMRYIERLEAERNDLRKELMNSVPASRYWAVNKDWLEAQAKQGDIANRAAEIIKDLEKKLELAQHERGEAR